jgi:hypothetical protein
MSHHPALEPDPRDVSSARLSVFAVERAVAYGDWLDRSSAPDADFRRRELAYLRRAARAARAHPPGSWAARPRAPFCGLTAGAECG